eukprot:887451-Prymnesium_polylepis.1
MPSDSSPSPMMTPIEWSTHDASVAQTTMRLSTASSPGLLLASRRVVDSSIGSLAKYAPHDAGS